LRPPFGLTIAPVTYLGVVGVMGLFLRGVFGSSHVINSFFIKNKSDVLFEIFCKKR
jgi:hypothetical protein